LLIQELTLYITKRHGNGAADGGKRTHNLNIPVVPKDSQQMEGGGVGGLGPLNTRNGIGNGGVFMLDVISKCE
jgi:hypothetical protein